MLRRRRGVDEGDPAGPTALASVSDLMTALMIVFLFGAVAANELTPKPPKPKPPAKGDEVWGLKLNEFEQRQLKLRVKVAWDRKFASLEPKPRQLPTQFVFTLASGKSPFDTKSVIAIAKNITATVYDTRWADIEDAGGCKLGIFPLVDVRGFSPPRSLEIYDLTFAVKDDLERFLKSRHESRRSIEAPLIVSTNSHIDLIISFKLDDATLKALAKRFATGPPRDMDRNGLLCR
jgi:hypothetical protein